MSKRTSPKAVKALKNKRSLEQKQWSKNMNVFLNENLDAVIGVAPRTLSASQTRIRGKEHQTSSSYARMKRALNSKLARRREIGTREIEKIHKLDEMRHIAFFKSLDLHPKESSKRVRDERVIERVISSRNDEYMEAANTLPDGFVADLKKKRKLPPDRGTFYRSSQRVFYWG